MKRYCRSLLGIMVSLLPCLMVRMAHADRTVLGPDGATLNPHGIKVEFAATPYSTERNLSWLQYALPQGIELQTRFLDILNDQRTLHALDVQYPFLSEFGPVPAVSFGVRDLLGTGEEHRSFYVAVARTLPLSDRQLKLFRDFRLSAGYGTERMDGIFFGLHTHLRAGMFVDVEYYRKRPNVSLALPLMRDTKVHAYSLNGNIYYGLSYTLIK